jgi:hypothetical protein
MPIIGWKCPIERTLVPFDHFETCTAKKGRPAHPPWLASFGAKKIQEDVRHSTLAITATRTMTCPRQTFIETLWDYYVNPSDTALRDRGTALHEVAAGAANPKVWITEKSDPVRMTLTGKLGGVELSMQCDAIRRDMTEIVDYKFPLDFAVSYRKGSKAKPEYSCQLNMARLFLAEKDWAIEAGYDPETVLLTIWNHAMGKNEGPMAQEAVHMTEQEILGTKPGGSQHTIEEIISIHQWMVEAYKKAGSPTDMGKLKEIAAQIPLVGEPMFNGTKCREYCDVTDICMGIVREYGRPTANWEEEGSAPDDGVDQGGTQVVGCQLGSDDGGQDSQGGDFCDEDSLGRDAPRSNKHAKETRPPNRAKESVALPVFKP